MKALITTEYRGVFAGEITEQDGRTITAKNVRNCIYWNAGCKGVFGLASDGPSAKCRIGPRQDEMTLYGVTSITPITDEAWKRWEDEPWD